MIMDMKRMVIEIQRRGIAPLNTGVGTCIECLRGTIWVTEHRSKDDIILEAGESYVISRKGLVVVRRCTTRSWSFELRRRVSLKPGSRPGWSVFGRAGRRAGRA